MYSYLFYLWNKFVTLSTMKGFPTLTLKRILRRHKQNPQDKELRKVIENGTVDRKVFDKVVEEGTKEEAFDKKK